MAIFVYATVVYFNIVRPPAETLEIYSTGKRWMWRFQHIDGQREINELHVPRGRPVSVTFTSEDVLHDLYIPAFRVKADAIPGRYSSIWFTPTQTGEFHLFCAEYCGTKHSGMIGRVSSWSRTTTRRGSPAAAASRWPRAASSCSSSSPASPVTSTDGTGRGPSLAGIFGSQVQLANGHRASWPTTRYIRESILTPQPKLVAGLPGADADVPGPGERRRRDEPDRVHQVAAGGEPRRRRRAAGHASLGRGRRANEGRTHDNHCRDGPARELPESHLDGGIVAADEGPQAHRHPVPGRA